MDILQVAIVAVAIVAVALVAIVILVGCGRTRIDPDEYRQATFPPDYGQPQGFFGWVLPVVLAPVVGAITALIAWNPWLLPIVTIAGAVLGLIVGYGLWITIMAADEYWLQLGSVVSYVAEPALWIGGPATTVLVGVLALVYAPDLSLPLWLGVPLWLGFLGAAMLGLRWWRSGHIDAGEPVSVPDVRGLTLPEAHRLADGSLLYISCAPITPRRLGNEVVVTQDPAPDEVVKANSMLRVTAAAPPAASGTSQ